MLNLCNFQTMAQITDRLKLLIADFYVASEDTHQNKVNRIAEITGLKRTKFQHIINEVNKYGSCTVNSKIN